MTDVFISYCRRNQEFVRKLNHRLIEDGRETWVDWDNIPPNADWRAEIAEGIEKTNTVLFVLSPQWLASYECKVELELAQTHNKRLLPIVCEDVQYKEVSPALASLNWIFFRKTDDFEQSYQALNQALDTDLQHIKTHTRILNRAIEWDKKDRDPSFLLRGKDFTEAEQWLKESGSKNPLPTALQTDYVISSGQSQSKRQKTTLIGVGVGMMLACGLAIAAFVQYGVAEARRLQVEELQTITLSETANATFANNDQLNGLLASVKANRQLNRLTHLPQAEYEGIEGNLRQLQELVLEENRMQGHQDLITNLRVSNNRQLIASTSTDNTIMLWRRTGERVAILKGHTSTVWSVMFSEDNTLIASTGEDRTVRLWTIDGRLLRTINFDAPVRSVSFSPLDHSLAIATADGTIDIRNPDGRSIKQWKQTEGTVFSIRFSPDGKTLLTGNSNKEAQLWNLDGKLLQTFIGHKAEVWAVRFSPDGTTIATASADNTVKLWNVQGQLLETLEGHQSGVISIGFSPNGQRLASCSADHTVRVWDTQGSLLNTFYHNDIVSGVDFLDDFTVVSGSYDKTIRIWWLDRELRQLLRGHQRRVLDAAISGDSRIIASSSTDGTIRLWQWGKKGAEFMRSIPMVSNGSQTIVPQTISLDRTGERLAVGSIDSNIYLLNQEGRLLKTLSGHQGIVSSIAISPDGQTIASASTDKTIKFWNWEGHLLRTLVGHQEEVRSVAFSPDGQLVASGSSDNTVKLWSWKTGQLLHTMQDHTAMVFSVAFAPDGKTLASGGMDNTIKVWSVDGQLLHSFKAHDSGVTSVSFSPDGQAIASGSFDNQVKLWRPDGMLRRIFTGHQQRVSAVRFSPNGQFLISAAADKVVKVWDMTKLDAAAVDRQKLIQASCDWLKNYLHYNLEVKQEDRQVCP